MSVHMRRLEDNGQPLASRKSTNDKNGRKGKSKNKCTTQMTQDEEVSDTDTEQQNSEH